MLESNACLTQKKDKRRLFNDVTNLLKEKEKKIEITRKIFVFRGDKFDFLKYFHTMGHFLWGLCVNISEMPTTWWTREVVIIA